MKYLKITKIIGLDILMNIVFAFWGLYAIGYTAGIIAGLFNYLGGKL